ncbi:hypothetical protein POM88_045008 [Heracleum sosnowskyi]|uniref:Uncharacterized protein n=1 Tax=Heracleum sosnowskyi TaxID=360622 RepID=A0AAD8H4Z6_9APIA|nr:hypothetical protein POM88_045008 [Heracleum sosnowskyi]
MEFTHQRNKGNSINEMKNKAINETHLHAINESLLLFYIIDKVIVTVSNWALGSDHNKHEDKSKDLQGPLDKGMKSKLLAGPDKEPIRIGNFTLEQLAGMCAEIPTDSDFEEMEDSGSNACLKRLNAEKESEFASKLSGLQTEFLKVEKRANDLDEVNKQLVLENAKSREAVISDFKGGPEYDQDVADAAAPEILRASLVSERHVKTDPNANWDSFVGEFLAAKLALEQGKGEPQPYDGPVPSFLPASSNPVVPSPDDHGA